MSVSTIQITAVKTYPVRIDIQSPVATGYFTGQAKVRSKAEFEKLRVAVVDGEYEGRDEDALREIYDRFDGFGDGDGFDAVLTGPASAYLYPAAIAAYFEHFGEARRGNSKTRRSR
jgi:hypothetical protein